MENVVNADQKRNSPFKFVLPLILLLVVGVIGFGVYEYFRIAPRDVRFTNVTSSSVTVSWNTKSPTSATALVFEGDTLLPLTILGLGGERFYDTRDVKAAELEAVGETSRNLFNDEELGISMEDISMEIEVVNMGEYYTHHVTISGLDSEKAYSFMVGDSFLYTKAREVSGISIVETLAVPNSVEAPIPAYGTIRDAQGSEDPGMLVPVYDGIVYFNLMDEFSGNRSNVYSGPLNEDGNWYIDISGIRVEDGEDFLSGEVIANVVGEIAIDAGPDGKWEGVLNSDIIAPAEMIVINDPLQGGFEGAGIKKVESKVLGDFTFDTEAASCLFAGYCGPCYEGVLTNPCTCPQSTLDSRPGCKGQEDGTTMEQAIAKVAGGGCSNGDPGEYVYFQSECKVCSKYIVEGVDKGYRWLRASPQSICDGHHDGVVFGGGGGGGGGEDTPCVTTPQAQLKVGSKCCRNGIWGTGKQVSVDMCPEGDCDAYGLSLYCNISGNSGSVSTTVQPKVGQPCDVPHGSGKWITRLVSGVEKLKCTAISCDEGDGYVRKFDVDKEVDVCVLSNGGVIPTSTTIYMPLFFGPVVTTGGGDDVLEEEGPTLGEGEGTKIGAASKCSPNQAPCYCDKAPYIGPNGYCPEVLSCIHMGQDTEGRICSTSGARCVNEVCAEKADEVSTINPGDPCDAPPMLSYELTESGSFCPQTYTCTYSQSLQPAEIDGKICHPSGTTCLNGTCSGPSALGSKGNEFLSSLVLGSHAQGTSSFLIDGGMNILEELPIGVYVFEYEGTQYRFLASEEGSIGLVYIDKNDNNLYDEGIDILLSDIASLISIQTVQRTYKYSIVKGMNFISFPYLISNPNFRTASGLLQELNKQFPSSVLSISRFEGGRWRIVGENVQIYDVNDFRFLPGEGYVIKAVKDFDLNLIGQPVKYETPGDTAPVTLFEGWNLIGLYGTGVKTYTAKTMIADINAANFTADNVSKWEKEKQSYEGFQFSEGQEYGFDFPINSLESVFVRVLEGRGNWQPKLGSQ